MYPEIWKIQLDRINDLYKNKDIKIKPVRLRIRLTNRCNLSCAFCIRNTFSKEKLDSPKEISEKKLLEIVDKFAKMGGRFVEITGDGEPCVRLDTLLNLMARIKKRGLFGELTTNGTLFTEDSIKKIVKMNWDMMRFSIDGKKETHDSLRGQKGTYEKAVKNMFLLKKMKDRLKKDNPQIRINFVLTNKNFNQIDDMLGLLKEVNGDLLWVTPMIIQIDSARNLLLNEKEKRSFMNHLDGLIDISKKYGINTNLDDFKNIFSNIINIMPEKKKEEIKTKIKNENAPTAKCFMPWSDIIIAEDGRVGPCLAFYFDKLNVKNETLNKIWFGKDFKNARNSILDNNLGFFCKDCRQWWGPEEANLIKSQLEDHELNKTFNALIKMKKYEEAIVYLKKRIKDYPKTALLYRNIGECYMNKKDYKNALFHLKKAVESEPNMEWTNFSIGKTYFLMKKYDEAAKYLRKNLSIEGQNPLSYHHGQLLISRINKIKKGEVLL